MPLRIAFDIGGVISKYPEIFIPLIKTLHNSEDVEVHIVTDMHVRETTLKILAMNGLDIIPPERVHNSDYKAHGELCKAVVLRENQIDVIIDDFPGYLTEGCPVRLQVMADPYRPYFHDDWKTDGSEGDFGRRTKGSIQTETTVIKAETRKLEGTWYFKPYKPWWRLFKFRR
jgi:hypothetical protein